MHLCINTYKWVCNDSKYQNSSLDWNRATYSNYKQSITHNKSMKNINAKKLNIFQRPYRYAFRTRSQAINWFVCTYRLFLYHIQMELWSRLWGLTHLSQTRLQIPAQKHPAPTAQKHPAPTSFRICPKSPRPGDRGWGRSWRKRSWNWRQKCLKPSKNIINWRSSSSSMT